MDSTSPVRPGTTCCVINVNDFAPKFERGDILFIDPNAVPTSADIVIASTPDKPTVNFHLFGDLASKEMISIYGTAYACLRRN